MSVHLATRRGASLLAGATALAMLLTACSDDEDSTAQFCEDFRAFEDDNQETSLDASNAEDLDIEEGKEIFADQVEQVDGLVEEAPEEIADDIEAQRDELTALNDDVQAAESPEELIEALSSVTETVDEDAVANRGERIEEWIADNCDSDGAR